MQLDTVTGSLCLVVLVLGGLLVLLFSLVLHLLHQVAELHTEVTTLHLQRAGHGPGGCGQVVAAVVFAGGAILVAGMALLR